MRGLPNPETVHAREGTRAHALAELALRRRVPAATFVGMELEEGVVTEDMADYVQTYVDFCESVRAASDEFFIERRFNLAPLRPPSAMFGTSDVVGKSPTVLRVVDLKYGQGVVVEADDNEQLMYYALGALVSFPGYVPEWIEMTIVQPRATHAEGPVRTATVSFEDLMAFGVSLLRAAWRTTEPDAPLKAGEWCRFCPAAAQCPAKHAEAERVAMVEFGAMGADVEHRPPNPTLVPLDTIAEWLPNLDILEQWIKDVRARAEVALRNGETVPGYKLVQKRATRGWGDAETAEQVLRAEGYDDEEILEPRKMKSPAQIEKLTGKKDFKAQIEAYVTKQSSGVKMVPESDPAPAVMVTRGEEFAALTDGEE